MAKRREVYKFTQLAEIRFKPESLNKPAVAIKFEEVKGWTSKFIQMAKQKIFGSADAQSNQVLQSQSTKKPIVDLTLTAYLNSQLILIGNQSKLDLIQIDINKQQEEMQVRLITEIFPSYPVKTITIERKKQFVLFNGDHNIELYVLDSKSHSLVQKFFYTSTEQIKGIQFIQDNCLLQYHDTYVNVLGLQSWQPQVLQTLHYGGPKSFKVYKIPPCNQNYGNIFMYDTEQYEIESKKQYPIVTMYTCQITYQNSQFCISKIQKFFQIQQQQLNTLIIYNYDINTVLFNLGYKMIVIKKHYPIDEITINHKDLHSNLFFLENRNIVHVCDTMIQSHYLEIFSNHINIKCFDCINFTKPANSVILSTMSLSDDKFILLFKLNNKSNTKETRYWITTTIQTSIKIKLESIFKRSRNNNKQIYESAVKMGMARNQIFNELWMQSNRRSKEDFDILLQSQDYKVITDGVMNVLKKQSISFKELVRIEKECFKILQDQIKRNPTETNIVHFLKCSFSLRKYRVEKRLETQKKKKMTSEQQPVNPTQVQLSIQQYQDIRKRNIKHYLLDLMKKCDPGSISIIKHMIDIFRMTFRHIFPNFMRQVIGQLKSGLLKLLQQYPQLLPLPKNASGNAYASSTHGVWADFLAEEWEDNIYFQNLQNIDNIKILQSLMTKDYFKWDWLVQHDFFKIKRAQFQNKFKQNREKGIFYIFFSQLFQKINDQDSLAQILKLIQQKYDIPSHLSGKTKLYYEIHKFFQQNIPDYNLSFQTFLSLKEDQIYKIIFTKNKKALVLENIKSIYDKVCKPQVYDQSILCYFKADYSSLADLKYLLNRVNSKKQQFHDENQNLYRILVQAAHYKLKWEQSQTLPISQVMVYYQNIPLPSQEIQKLNKIQNLGYHMDILQKLELDINLRQFFDNGVNILNKVAYYLVKIEAPELNIKFQTDRKSGQQSFNDMLNQMLLIRDNLFYQNQIDDQKVLELFVFNLLDYDDYLMDVKTILKDDRLLRKFHRPNFQSFLEKIITEKVSQAFRVQASFKSHQKYINGMIQLLDKNSTVRKQLYAHLQLGLLLSVLSNPPKAPLIISVRFIENIVAKQSIQTIKSLDIQKIYNYMLLMGIQQPITNLYEVLIVKYLAEGQWNEAIKFTKLWNDHHQSISFSATVMLRLGQQLPRDLRPQLVDIVIMRINDPSGILQLAHTVINNFDAKDRRRLIEAQIKKGDDQTQQSYQNNYLSVVEFRQMTYPSNSQYVKNLYDELMKSDGELQNNYIYYMYYRILMCDPLKAAEFHIKNFDFLDIKVLKTLICQLSKKLFKQSEQYLFDRQELYLFMYKCLIVSYSSNFLSKQFVLQSLLRFGLEDIEIRYGSLLEELKKAMIAFGQKQKIALLRFFKKLYYKSVDNLSVNPFELSEEEEQNTAKHIRTISSSSNKIIPFKTKKSLYQMLPVQQDRNISTYNNLIQPSVKDNVNYKLVSKSVRSSYKPPLEDQIPDIKLKTQNKSVLVRNKVNQLSPGLRNSEEQMAINILNSQNQDEQSAENTTRQLKYENGNKAEQSKEMGFKKDSSFQNKSVSIENLHKQQITPKENEGQVVQQPQLNRKRVKIDQTPSLIQEQMNQKNINDSKNPSGQQQGNDKVPFLQRSRFAESISGDSNPDQIIDHLDPAEINHHSDPNLSGQKQQPFDEEIPIVQRNNIVKVRDKRHSNFSEAVKFSSQFPHTTQRDIPVFDQSKLQNSQMSSLYQLQQHNTGQQNVFTINIKQQDTIIDSSKINLSQMKYGNQNIIDELIKGNYDPLFEQIQQNLDNQLNIIKSIVNQIFPKITFTQYVAIIDKLRQLSIKYHSAVKAQNFKIIKNASKVSISSDVKSIFTPDILYITSQNNNIDQTNKLIFKHLKPKIILIIQQQNVFTIAKAVYFSLNFNKSFEFRVQYYYLQKLFRQLLLKQTQQQINMDLQKIQMLLSKLPINMTTQRIDKMLLPIMNNQKTNVLIMLMRSFLKALQEKKNSMQAEKYQKQIQSCEQQINKRLQNLQSI